MGPGHIVAGQVGIPGESDGWCRYQRVNVITGQSKTLIEKQNAFQNLSAFLIDKFVNPSSDKNMMMLQMTFFFGSFLGVYVYTGGLVVIAIVMHCFQVLHLCKKRPILLLLLQRLQPISDVITAFDGLLFPNNKKPLTCELTVKNEGSLR